MKTLILSAVALATLTLASSAPASTARRAPARGAQARVTVIVPGNVAVVRQAPKRKGVLAKVRANIKARRAARRSR